MHHPRLWPANQYQKHYRFVDRVTTPVLQIIDPIHSTCGTRHRILYTLVLLQLRSIQETLVISSVVSTTLIYDSHAQSFTLIHDYDLRNPCPPINILCARQNYLEA